VAGPLTGAVVGFCQAGTDLLVWVAKGKPVNFFSQWVNWEIECLVLSIGGGVTGVLYGALLWGFELLARRRIRPVSMLLTIGSGCALQAIASCAAPPMVFPMRFEPQAIACATKGWGKASDADNVRYGRCGTGVLARVGSRSTRRQSRLTRRLGPCRLLTPPNAQVGKISQAGGVRWE
jgi:hypothetical protein